MYGVQVSKVKSFLGTRVVSRSTTSQLLSRTARSNCLVVESKRVCDLTGKKRNKANVVTFSNRHIRKFQQVNLQKRKVYWPEGQRWVKMKVSTSALKTIQKIGLQAMADKAGIDLMKLPFTDARPERREWLAKNNDPPKPPTKKNTRKMKNQEKLAASKKTPLVASYYYGKILYSRADAEELDGLK
eukprot:TRINITY_DN1643_c0_g1_i1.p2 TRINITY_DN1643_c0_g1~~TRINITY_DN1643_c0_g1_i1.p2  ORF type:complete len:195 (-),score=9.76 TRINITY_DN1643_c0_g1_i1:336-893(-)